MTQSHSGGARKAVSRIATAFALALANIAAPERLLTGLVQGRLDGGLGAVPALAVTSSKQLSATRQKRVRMTFKNKLAKVPVFMVTNDGGSPFLSSLQGGDQSALMHLFPADAQRMLNGVLKAPNGASSGAKVLTSNLDRAFKLAMLQPAKSGLKDQVTGRELTMVWQFSADKAEQMAATGLLVKKMKAPRVPQIPAYMVEGLTYTKRGKEVRPVFLCRKDLEAAVAAVSAEMGGSPDVEVIDLLEFLLTINEAITEDTAAAEADIASIDIVAPSESLDFKDSVRSDKKRPPVKIVPPDHRWR